MVNDEEILKEQSLNKGHRKRLRERFLLGKEVLGDYEILEMVLFLSNKRKDTKSLAKLLLKTFGSLKNIFNADIEELKTLPELGDATAISIKLIQEILRRVLKDDIKNIEIKLDNVKKVEDYCRANIGHLKREHILILFLNNKSNLITDEIIAYGNSHEVKLYKNFLITRATQLGATSIILVHNHPTGDPEPSIEDIELTFNIKDLLEQVDMKLLDHIIVSENSSFSMGKEGLLEKGGATRYKNKKARKEKAQKA